MEERHFALHHHGRRSPSSGRNSFYHSPSNPLQDQQLIHDGRASDIPPTRHSLHVSTSPITNGLHPSPNYIYSHRRRNSHTRNGSISSTASSATLIPSPETTPTTLKAEFMANRSPFQKDRPLIDYVTNDWRYDKDLDASDEDEAFYAKDDADYLVHPQWKALVAQSQNRVPRKIQRYILIYITLLLIIWFSWRWWLGPQYRVYREEQRQMDALPKTAFGTNMRPAFSDMIQVKTMDSRLLPTSSGSQKSRLVVIGDVHGCREELEHLLKKVDFNEEKDHLILTGDIIAKGPDSPGVVSLAQKLGASCVRGNHEDRMLLAVADMRAHHVPLPGPEESVDRTEDTLDEESFSHGDYKTRKLAKSFTDDQIRWLQQCPVILRVGEIPGMGDVVVVHAGLVPDVALERQDPFQCMNMRSIDLETRVPSEDSDGTPWYKLWNHQQEKRPKKERTTVVYGHWAKRGLNIKKYTKGLDSSCVKGGKLSALVIEAGKHGKDAKTEVVSVNCKGYA